jgi:hypothetical protein
VDDLYKLVEEDKKLKKRIKMIGICAGNSEAELKMYRETFKVPFPLFADNEFALHKQLGEVKTPYFIGVKINGDGTHEVIFSKLGPFRNAEKFLATMVEKAGL